DKGERPLHVLDHDWHRDDVVKLFPVLNKSRDRFSGESDSCALLNLWGHRGNVERRIVRGADGLFVSLCNKNRIYPEFLQQAGCMAGNFLGRECILQKHPVQLDQDFSTWILAY